MSEIAMLDRPAHVLLGNALEALARMPTGSVHSFVTSPPYFQQRDYGLPPTVWGGDAGCVHAWEETIVLPPKRGDASSSQSTLGGGKENQRHNYQGLAESCFCGLCGAWRGCLGLEPTPDLYVEHLVMVFREARRVLRADGSLWLNLGDSYARDTKWGGSTGGKHAQGLHGQPVGRNRAFTGLKDKDLIGIPWKAAFALQDDGWWLRSASPWIKSNALPESVTDRYTNGLEYIFHLAPSKSIYFDVKAVRKAAAPSSLARIGQKTFAGQTGGEKDYRNGTNANRSMRKTLEHFAENPGRNRRNTDAWVDSLDARIEEGRAYLQALVGIKAHGGVAWEGETPVGFYVPTSPSRKNHFASWPPALIEPMILTATSEKGCCADCGAPWKRATMRVFYSPEEWAAMDSAGAIKGRIFFEEECEEEETEETLAEIQAEVQAETLAAMVRSSEDIFTPSCTCRGHFEKVSYLLPTLASVEATEYRSDVSLAEHPVRPCVVGDPFSGTGTTGEVALALGREYVGIELNPEYLAISVVALGQARDAGRQLELEM